MPKQLRPIMTKIFEAIIILILLISSFFFGVSNADSVKQNLSWVFQSKEQELEVPENIHKQAETNTEHNKNSTSSVEQNNNSTNGNAVSPNNAGVGKLNQKDASNNNPIENKPATSQPSADDKINNKNLPENKPENKSENKINTELPQKPLQKDGEAPVKAKTYKAVKSNSEKSATETNNLNQENQNSAKEFDSTAEE